MDSTDLIPRDLGRILARAAQSNPIVTVTGPRQSGKTTLCRQTFRDKPWVSLEARADREYATSDPRGFLAQYRDGAILDEIQRAPELLSYLQTEVDERPQPGRYILTGSENLALSERVSQSLAGRNRTLHLLPPSFAELQRFEAPPRDLWTTVWKGAYPRIHRRPSQGERPQPQAWLDDYIAAYVERDVRQVSRVIDLEAFRKFLNLAAGRTAQEINRSELGADAGVSQPTAREWLSLLETSFVCFQLPAWHRNVRKQQVKSPKLHFFDTGLLCALLNIRDPEQLRVHSLRGAIFETWVASEILKARLHRGLRRNLHHYRESRGLELDLVVTSEELFLVEVKSGETVVNEFFRSLRQVSKSIEESETGSQAPRAVLVYGGSQLQQRTDVLVLPWREIHTVPWGTSEEDSPELDAEVARDELADARPHLIARLFPQFSPGGRFHGRYEVPDARSLEPLARQGSTWQLPIIPEAAASAHVLRVYDLGAAPDELLSVHWRNEARTLHRLASSGHPAIPKLHDSGRLSSPGAAFGFVVLDDTGHPVMPGHPVLDEWKRRPDKAFVAFVVLAEAIALLHEEGVLHRTLTPLATRAPADPDGMIMLDDFQLSTFVTTWLQRGAPSEPEASLPGSSPLCWACLAPERLGALLGPPQGQECLASDVFALGMIGFGWLVEPFDRWPVDRVVSGGCYDERAHRDLLAYLEDHAHTSALPASLRNLLLSMVAFDPSERPVNARDVYDALCRMYGSALTHLEQDSRVGTTMQLHYLIESVGRLYGDGRARTPPERPDYREYARLIAADLADGMLTWSTRGPLPWVQERDPERVERMLAARVVLLGEHYVYFCQYLHQGRTEEERRVLVVKYMVSARQAQDLRHQPRLRPIPVLEPRLFDPKVRHQRQLADDTPSWEPLVTSVQFQDRHPASAPLIQAGRWLRDVQLAQLALDEYAVERVEDSTGRSVLRQVDRSEIDEGDSRDPGTEDSAFVRLRLTTRRRPPMGKSFEELRVRALEEDREQLFDLRTSRKQRAPDQYHLERSVDEHTVVLRETGDLPRRGFLCPDDLGSRRVLGRQAVALEEVEKRYPYLAAQLAGPTAVELPLEGHCNLDHLDAHTSDLVKRILSAWPLFILQGPPGTGKTFVARQVVRAILEMDPFARILIAAQSHHALDNLLEGVVGEVAKDHITLRISSIHNEHKLGEIANQHTLKGAVTRVLERVDQATSTGVMASTKEIAKRWRKHPRRDLDIAQRIKRSASVAFATCTAATSRALGVEAGRGFDWVVVEEAARAWIIELLMPMLHGTRWLLIGDHRQLPAFQAEEIRRLLAKDASDQITAKATGVEVDRSWDRFLRHFEHLMEAPAAPFGFDPRDTMTVQRRMHPDIGMMVSRTFYEERLQTHPEATRSHGLRAPAFVEGTALVWVDTSAYGTAASERGATRGGYENLCEAALVARLLEGLSPSPVTHDPKIPPLFVLTPYRAQTEAIRRRVGVHHHGHIDTIDAFQGREAEVVVVSLVRSSPSSGQAGIGFLREPERVNVLLSRARRLLVIVGDLATFARSEHAHWQSIVEYVRSESRYCVNPLRAIDFQWPERRARRSKKVKK